MWFAFQPNMTHRQTVNMSEEIEREKIHTHAHTLWKNYRTVSIMKVKSSITKFTKFQWRKKKCALKMNEGLRAKYVI